MLAYTLKRLVQGLITVWFIATATFVAMHSVPGDPLANERATPEQIRPLFRRARIIGRRLQLVHVVFGQEIIETSSFRAPASEDQETDEHGRILRDNVFGSQ